MGYEVDPVEVGDAADSDSCRLPGLSSSLVVGREVELREVLASLESEMPAVVSISGLSGSGKSTLATAAAATVAEDPEWSIAWVDVAAESASLPLSAMVQRCLAVDDLEPSTLRLANYGRRILIVLDGADGRFDEIAKAVAPLECCPSVRVMLTSIRRIRRRNVVSVPVGGLEVPPAEADGTELTKYASVELFVSVATQMTPEFAADEAVLSEVARVCRALNGLPLAVKLAAGRLARPLSTPARMSHLVQSDPAFGLILSVGAPGSEPNVHHHSVQAALEWTYSLLDPTQQHVLRRVSVFLGPFDLEAAERVCEIPRSRLLEPLEDMVGLGLLELAADQVAEIRCKTHPLIRRFAAEALAEAGETTYCFDLYADFLASLARRASCHLDRNDADADVELRTVESDLYAALDYLLETGQRVKALRLAADLGHFAAAAGHGDNLLTSLVGLLADLPRGTDHGMVADAWLWAAELMIHAKTAPDTVELWRARWHEGMALARSEDEPDRLLRGLGGAVLALPVTGDFEQAKAAAAEGRRLAREAGHAAWLARFTAWSGMVSNQEQDFTTAAQCAAEGLGIALRSSDRRALVLVGLLYSGLPEEHAPTLPSLPALEELYAMAVDLGDRGGQSWLLGQLTGRASQRGDNQAAAAWLLRRLELVRGSTAWHALGFSLLASVAVLADGGYPKLAARVHGSLAAMMPVLMAGMGARDQSSHAARLSNLELLVGSDVYHEQIRAGSQEDWPDMLLAIMPNLEEAASAKRPTNSQLTKRETEVLQLLSDGMSNKDIANRLGLSAKTVMHHTVSIYRKLGVSGRSDAAATAIRMGLGSA